MPTDIGYVLYDTAIFGVTANVESLLFQVQQGGDAVHVESFCNMRGPGFLPTGEKFILRKLSAFPDVVLAPADIQTWLLATFVEFRLNNKTLFKAPIQLIVDAAAYGGAITLAVAADRAPVGLAGDGYELINEIVIPGATPFVLRVVQGTSMGAAARNIKFAMHGILTLGD